MSHPPSMVSGRHGSAVEPFSAVDVLDKRDAASDDMASPPPAPSSGTGVRRNHTIHGVRHPAEPRLEKHFEQPEISSHTSVAHAISHTHSSSPSSSDFATDSGSSHSSAAVAELASGLTPLQALYAKSTVSRNHSLPSRHSSKVVPNLTANAAQRQSSLFNSLSAITGGADVDEHDWEKLIRSSNVLDNEHPPGIDLPVPSLQTETTWSDSLFDHRRFPSGPAPAQRHSPVARAEHQADPNRFKSNSMAMDALDVGTFAPSATSNSNGFIRRHQSLNHNSGRLAADRLAARSSRLPGGNERGAGTGRLTPSFSTRLEYPFSPDRQANSASASSSPIAPIGHARTPWNAPPHDVIGSPSRYAGSFASQNVIGAHSPADTFADLSSPPALGLHSDLARLSMSESAPSHVTPRLAPSSVSDPLPMRPSLVSHGSSSSINSNLGRKLPSLVTNRDDLQQGIGSASMASGPASAAAFVPPIGHGHARQQSHDPFSSHQGHDYDHSRRFGPYTSVSQGHWQDKERIAGRSDAPLPPGTFHNVSPQPNFDAGAYRFGNDMDPNMRALSIALAHEQQKNAMLQAQLGAHTHAGGHDAHMFGMTSLNSAQPIAQQLRGSSNPSAMGHPPNRNSVHGPRAALANQHGPSSAVARDGNAAEGAVNGSSSLNLIPLAVQKGYNPAPGTFDLTPPSARFFVIKSYTEADVHKSLKYEIWASTDKGNQRLDKAFRDSAHSGPIYLFYSVNASGHFCGMAQMLTPLDYTTSSNVWAQDGKWKGTFKVRWIFVKDLPNSQLRHIRLTNTQECKPVTQSRDTQELTSDAGREVLKIMSAYTAKTSLLQDFQFYELQGKQALSPASMASPSAMPVLAAGSPTLTADAQPATALQTRPGQGFSLTSPPLRESVPESGAAVLPSLYAQSSPHNQARSDPSLAGAPVA